MTLNTDVFFLSESLEPLIKCETSAQATEVHGQRSDPFERFKAEMDRASTMLKTLVKDPGISIFLVKAPGISIQGASVVSLGLLWQLPWNFDLGIKILEVYLTGVMDTQQFGH